MADLEAKTNAALTTGIIGTAGTALGALGLLGGGSGGSGGGLGGVLSGLVGGGGQSGGVNGMAETAALAGLFGALGAGRHADCGCYPVGAYNTAPICENQIVNRYELGLVREIDTLKAGIAQRDANTYTDQKLLDVYKYFDTKVQELNGEICGQRVINQRIEDSFGAVHADMNCLRNEFDAKLKAEKAARCCGDNAIVTYVNGTFYPRLTADVTVGTETTAAQLYNPVTNCGCGCGCD